MKKNHLKLSLFIVSILILFIFCGCSITVDFQGTKYDITIHNDVCPSIVVSMNGGTSTVVIAPSGQVTLNLEEGTQIMVYVYGDITKKFAVDDVTGVYTFTLDGEGYTLFAEYGCINLHSLRVTRVL